MAGLPSIEKGDLSVLCSIGFDNWLYIREFSQNARETVHAFKLSKVQAKANRKILDEKSSIKRFLYFQTLCCHLSCALRVARLAEIAGSRRIQSRDFVEERRGQIGQSGSAARKTGGTTKGLKKANAGRTRMCATAETIPFEET
jgi:hypothetical protein